MSKVGRKLVKCFNTNTNFISNNHKVEYSPDLNSTALYYDGVLVAIKDGNGAVQLVSIPVVSGRLIKLLNLLEGCNIDTTGDGTILLNGKEWNNEIDNYI